VELYLQNFRLPSWRTDRQLYYNFRSTISCMHDGTHFFGPENMNVGRAGNLCALICTL